MRDNGDPEFIWRELSRLLRSLRHAAGVSLRQVEAASPFGRGALSSMETASSRPSRAVVEYYDREFGGQGLAMSLFAEARAARGATRSPRGRSPHHDVLRVEWARVPLGQLVPVGAAFTVGWRLLNDGSAAWQDRSLARVGPPAGPGLLASGLGVPVPDTAPGASADLTFSVRAPEQPATVAAYWRLVDAAGRPTTPGHLTLHIVVVADEIEGAGEPTGETHGHLRLCGANSG